MDQKEAGLWDRSRSVDDWGRWQCWRGWKRRTSRQRTGAAGGVGVVDERMHGQRGEGYAQYQHQCQTDQPAAPHHFVQPLRGG